MVPPKQLMSEQKNFKFLIYCITGSGAYVSGSGGVPTAKDYGSGRVRTISKKYSEGLIMEHVMTTRMDPSVYTLFSHVVW